MFSSCSPSKCCYFTHSSIRSVVNQCAILGVTENFRHASSDHNQRIKLWMLKILVILHRSPFHHSHKVIDQITIFQIYRSSILISQFFRIEKLEVGCSQISRPLKLWNTLRRQKRKKKKREKADKNCKRSAPSLPSLIDVNDWTIIPWRSPYPLPSESLNDRG